MWPIMYKVSVGIYRIRLWEIFLYQSHNTWHLKFVLIHDIFNFFRIVTLLLIFMYGKFTNLFCDIVNMANTGWIYSWGLICWSFYARVLVLWNCSKIFCNSMEDPLTTRFFPSGNSLELTIKSVWPFCKITSLWSSEEFLVFNIIKCKLEKAPPFQKIF